MSEASRRAGVSSCRGEITHSGRGGLVGCHVHVAEENKLQPHRSVSREENE